MIISDFQRRTSESGIATSPLSKESKTPSQPETGGTVSGKIIDALTGSPVGNAEIHITKPHGNLKRIPTTTTLTDSRGSFSSGQIPNDDYVLFITPPSPYKKTVRSIKLKDNKNEVMENIALQLGSTLYGKIVDHNGNPVPYKNIILSGSGYKGFGSVMELTMSDKNGRFKFTDLADMKYTIKPESEVVTANASISDSKDTTATVQLGYITLHGKIENTGNFPISSVSLLKTDGETQQIKQVNKDGTFTGERLIPGNYNLQVYSAPGEEMHNDAFEIPAETETFNLSVKIPTGSIKGKLTNYTDLEYTSFVYLSKKEQRLWNLKGIKDTSSSSPLKPDGTFEFQHLTPGLYTVSIENRTTQSSAKKTDIKVEDSEVNVDLTLE